jgi:putative ABC transport system substrate-binding protein
MKRRAFITLLGGAAAAWPLAARGQQSKVARIGALYIGTADAESFKKELREGLRELGYVEGQNIAFEFRSAEGKLDRLPWSLMPGLDREHRKQEKRHAG